MLLYPYPPFFSRTLVNHISLGFLPWIFGPLMVSSPLQPCRYTFIFHSLKFKKNVFPFLLSSQAANLILSFSTSLLLIQSSVSYSVSTLPFSETAFRSHQRPDCQIHWPVFNFILLTFLIFDTVDCYTIDLKICLYFSICCLSTHSFLRYLDLFSFLHVH